MLNAEVPKIADWLPGVAGSTSSTYCPLAYPAKLLAT